MAKGRLRSWWRGEKRQARDGGVFTRFGLGNTAAGVSVNETTAMQTATVYACVRAIAETVAAIPCQLHRVSVASTTTGQRVRREQDRAHPLWRVLSSQPNEWQSARDYWELVLVHLLLKGNHYSAIERDGAARVTGLIPIEPNSVHPVWTGSGLERKPVYRVTLPNEGQKDMFPGEIFHVRGLPNADGLLGLSPIAHNRETIGMALAAREFGARLFKNDARPPGVLEVPEALSDKAFARLRDGWEKAHSGENQHRIAILEDGVSYRSIGLSAEDAQYLETRQFTDLEICRIFRVPPTKVGILEKSTFNNVEEQNRQFVGESLVGQASRIEAAISRDLLTESTRRTHEASFDFSALLRGDSQTQASVYALGIQNGWLSQNDVRERLGENPIGPEGDVYLTLGSGRSSIND